MPTPAQGCWPLPSSWCGRWSDGGGLPAWWQTVLYSVTASVTFVMVFVIQHTQGRQIAATQRKLDELIRTTSSADHAVIALEEAPDEELQALTDLSLEDRERATSPNRRS